MLEVVHFNPSYFAFIAHGHCYLWNLKLVGLHAVSDSLIALAYFSIPIALIYFVQQRRDLPYPWLWQLFSAFIVACGSTHLMEVWTLWHPTYWVSGALKALTAIISLFTVGVLIPVIPQALLIPSRAELEAAKAALEDQVQERTQALRASEARYKFLLNTVEGIVWELDLPNFQFTFVSQKAEKVLGYPVEQWLTEPHFWRNHLHPDDLEATIDLCDRMTQALEDHEMEYRMIAADGHVVWLWDLVKVVVEGDRPVKLQGIMVDISDRKAAEQALQETNRRFCNLAANIPGAVFRYVLRSDGSDAVLYMSPGCYRLWEVEADVVEADATILWQVVHPDDQAAMYESVLTSARTLQPWSWSWRITTPSGQQKWLEAAGRPERQANGDVVWDTVILDVTARKQTEIALQHSENRLQLALEASGEGLWDWNLKTGNFYLNARYEEMLGYSSGEIKMDLKVWEDLIHPDDKDFAVASLNAYVNGTAAQYAFDYRLRCKSGEWKWVANFGKIVAYDDQHKPLRIVGIHTDISDRKAAEIALAESQQRYQNLVENSPDIIERFDTQLRHLYVSPALTQLTGIAAEVFLGKTCREVWPDEVVVDTWEAAVAQLLSTGQRQTIEFKMATLHGERLFEMAISPEWSEHQTIQTILCISRDITDRKAAEAALAETQQRYQDLIENSPDIIERFDLQLRHLYVSPALTRITGITPEVFLGKTCRDLSMDTDMVNNWEAAAARLLSTGQRQTIEFSTPTLHGIRTFEMAIAPELSEHQEIESILCISRDITDRKAAEQALKVQRDFNQLTTDITSRFVNLNPADLDAEIVHTLRLISEVLQVETSYLVRFNEDGCTLSLTHEWCQPGWPQQFSLVQKVSLDLFPCSIAQIQQRETVAIPDIATAPAAMAIDKAGWQQFHLTAVLAVPLVARTGVVGMLGVASFSRAMTWDDETIRLLNVLGRTIASAQQQAQDEQQLAINEERLRLALTAANQGLYDINLQTGEAIVTPEYARMLGYEPEAFQENSVFWSERLHPDDRTCVETTYRNYLAGELSEYKVEFRQRTRTGGYRWILSLGKIVAWDANGQPLRMVGTHTDITERKQSEAALKESEARWQFALEGPGDGVWDWNLESNEVFFSLQWKKMLGYDEQEVSNRLEDWEERVHPDDKARCYADLDRHFSGETTVYQNEHRMRCKDGSYKWILARGKLIAWTPDGKPARIIGTHTDITDRKQAAADLQASEERLRLALEAAKQGLYDINLQTGEAILSPEYIEMLGYTPEEFDRTDKGWCDRLHPDEREAVSQAYQEYISGKRSSYQLEFRQRTKAGAYKWILSLGKIVAWNEEGRPLRMIGTHTDITERKQGETQLRDVTVRLELAVQAAKMGIWDWDLLNNRLTWDDRIYELYGLDRAVTPTYQMWESVIHPDDLPYCQAIIQRDLAENNEGAIEFRVQCPDGTIRYIASYSLIQRRSDGQPVRLIGVNLDISDRKQGEIQLRDLNDRLKLAMQAAKMGIWELDIVNDRLTWDDRTYELYGLQPGLHPATLETWESVIHPEDVARCRDVTYQTLVDKSEGALSLRALLPDGTLRYIESYFLVQQNAQGQPLRMVGVDLDITERKRAEAERLQAEKLRLELRLLERILDSVLAGYWDWDIPNHWEYMSPGLKQMFGYEDHELENAPETWQRLIFAEDLPGVMACFERHVRSHGKEPYYNEVRYRHKDGSTIWVLCAGQVIEWAADGQPLRMVGCHVDITQLKQTEAQLQKSEAHLRQAQRISKLGSWEFELATEKITWSDQVFAIFGRDPAMGTPKSFTELQQLIVPADRDFHQATVANTIATLQPYDIECQLQRPDGTLAYMQAKGEAITNALGQVVQLVGTVLDITERKQAEMQLQLLSDRLTLALQAGAIGTWDWDLLNEVRWDERMYEIYGLQDLGRAALYQDWIGQLHPDDIPTVEAVLQAAVRGEQDYRVEFRTRRPDGELRWIRAEAIVRRDQKGEALHMIGINYDITDSKQAEAKLLQTKAQLEASNRELEAFAYSVSHDLRAPLRAIDGFSKALLEDYGDRFDDEGRDYFDRIRRNVQRMGMLIDDLLRLSRVSRSEMQYTTINLSALVQEQINDLQASEPNRTVKFTVAPDAIVVADLTLMRVVICNLLENAWKFTSHHSCACIEFGIIETDAESIYFVRDDGAGFDMTYVSKLFGVFQRLHGIDQFPGTGIGLATVQRAVHRHGGRVWAEAAIEQGATIYFTLPNQSLITGG